MTDTAAVRLCKDCRWIEWSAEFPHVAQLTTCGHPTSVLPAEPDLVTGEPTQPFRLSCKDARKGWLGPDACGPDARHWEAS